MTNQEISDILEEIASLLELRGENAFKVRAFRNGARIAAGFEGDLPEAARSGKLRTIKGIGPTLASVITDLVITGKSLVLDGARGSIPPGVLGLLKIPGLGPKRAKTLYDSLGVTSTGELEYACLENRLIALPGFGEKTQARILERIRQLERTRGQFLQDSALSEAESLLAAIKDRPTIHRMAVTGSLRRRKETVKDIDLVASSSTPLSVMDDFTALPNVGSVTAKGETKASIVLKSGIAADLRVVPEDAFPYALHHFTGSKEHNTALRGYAKLMGLKMNEYGLFKGEDRISCRTEEEIFQALGLAFIPPELREDAGEIEAAATNSLPDLIRENDIRGIFHNHTLYSDGNATADAMIRYAKALGYSYIGISDHSQSAFYANGLKEERIKIQQAELDEIARHVEGIRVFKGVESDILADGSLDYPESVLETFDFIVASIHGRFQMDEAQMTQRIVRAIENPHTTILGHPTGRLLLAREPYAVNMDAVFDAAATCGVAIEINANPHRLDLDWRMCRRAKEKGVRFCINPDAHGVDGLRHVRFGVGVARKGWLTAEDVINCMPVDAMERYLDGRGSRRGADP